MWSMVRGGSPSAGPRSGWCWRFLLARANTMVSVDALVDGRLGRGAAPQRRTDDAVLCRPAAQGAGAGPTTRHDHDILVTEGGATASRSPPTSSTRSGSRSWPGEAPTSCERATRPRPTTLRRGARICGPGDAYAEFADVDAVRGRGPPARRAAAGGARGPDRRRPGRRRRRRAGRRDRGSRRRAPVPGAAVGPADAGAVPVGPPARRPGRVPAGPVGAGRRARHRARARAAAAGGGHPRPGPRPRRRRAPTPRPARRAPARAWTPSALPSWVATPSSAWLRAALGRRRAPGGGGSCRCSDPRASARPAWSPSSPGRSMPTAVSCSTAGATTPTAAPGPCSTRRCAAPAARWPGVDDGGPVRRSRRRRRPLPAHVVGGPARPGRARRPPPGRRRRPRGRRRPRRLVARPSRCSSSARSAPTPASRPPRSPPTPDEARPSSCWRASTPGAVGRICALYADGDWSADEVTRLHELTGGVPLQVHEQASEWARQRAARRVEDAADRLTGARARLADVAGRDRRQRGGDRAAARAAAGPARRPGGHRPSRPGLEPCARTRAWPASRRPTPPTSSAASGWSPSWWPGCPAPACWPWSGRPGAGKSSLVRAGVLPALAAGVLPGTDGWRTVAMCPGAHPARELARQLAPAGGRGADATGCSCSSTSSRRRSRSVRDDAERDEFVGQLVELVDRRRDGRGARHPGRPPRPLRRLPGARRAGRRQRRARRARCATSSCGGRSSSRPSGPASNSNPVWPRSSSPMSPAGPAPFPCCRPRWPRRGNAGSTDADPGRLPGRGRRQRRPGPPGRGRLPGAAATARGRPPGGCCCGCATPATTAPSTSGAGCPIGEVAPEHDADARGRARRARRPPAAHRRPRRGRGRPRGAAARVAPAAHLARRGRAGPPAPPPPRRRRPVVGGQRPRPVRALPRHPARRRRRLGGGPRRRPQRHRARVPRRQPGRGRAGDRPMPAGGRRQGHGPTGASSDCSPGSPCSWCSRWWPALLFLRQRNRGRGRDASDHGCASWPASPPSPSTSIPSSASCSPWRRPTSPGRRASRCCRRRSPPCTRRSRLHGSRSGSRRTGRSPWTPAPTAPCWPPARLTRQRRSSGTPPAASGSDTPSPIIRSRTSRSPRTATCWR